MRHPFRNALYLLMAAGWTAAVAVGISKLWGFESAPGAAGQAPMVWPADTTVPRGDHQATLVMLVHPQCSCSRATLDELAKIMTDCRGKLTATVMVVHPAKMPVGWERTDLWTSAASIPDVVVKSDEGGQESRRFGATTSGQTLLYSADGRLLFSGGITESRGHAGDNAGESAIEALVLDHAGRTAAAVAHTPVYGCGLFNDLQAGSPVCRQ